MTSKHEKKDESPEPQTFKQQLDQEADSARNGSSETSTNPIISKIAEYLPAAAQLIGGSSPESKAGAEDDNASASGPPHRPLHDDKIEEFVRDQHRSNSGAEILGAGKQ